MSELSKKEPLIGIHRLVGLALVPVLIFALLSLLTYDWRDVSWLQMPPNHPPANLIGEVGAWSVFFGYNLFGVGIWIVPVWLTVASAMLIFNRADELWCRTGWSVAFLLALCALLQLASGVLDGTLENLNIEPNAGGAMGNWLMTCSLQQWLSPVGGGLLALAVLLFTGVMAIGPARLVAMARGFVEGWRTWRQQHAEAVEKRAAVRQEQEQVVAEQEDRKAAERGFVGSARRERKTEDGRQKKLRLLNLEPRTLNPLPEPLRRIVALNCDVGRRRHAPPQGRRRSRRSRTVGRSDGQTVGPLHRRTIGPLNRQTVGQWAGRTVRLSNCPTVQPRPSHLRQPLPNTNCRIFHCSTRFHLAMPCMATPP